LGERLLCKQEVDGSIPFSSTSWEAADPRIEVADWWSIIAVCLSLFVIVEREWSDRLGAGWRCR
jgi:hypothetical protein